PNRTAPARHPDAAGDRRNLVLQLMSEQRRSSASAAERASHTRISARTHATPSVDGRYFRDFVAKAAPRRLPSRGVAVYTTLDATLRVRTPRGPWEPTNYDRSFRGPVTFREAMEQSINVPFARIGLAVGPERIVSAARRLGVTSPLTAVPSLALGSSEVTLL